MSASLNGFITGGKRFSLQHFKLKLASILNS